MLFEANALSGGRNKIKVVKNNKEVQELGRMASYLLVIRAHSDIQLGSMQDSDLRLRDKPHSFFAPEGKHSWRGLNPRPLASNSLPLTYLGVKVVANIVRINSWNKVIEKDLGSGYGFRSSHTDYTGLCLFGNWILSTFIKARQILEETLILNEIVSCKWRGGIRGCLHSSKALVSVNGSPTENVLFHRGLRQGDHLSLFLFILVMESLHVAFQRVTDRGDGLPDDLPNHAKTFHDIGGILPRRLGVDSSHDLKGNISNDEIKKAVWDCGSDKSPVYLIKARQILDGTLILNEIVSCCKSRKEQALLFKVDFQKAFDSLRWDHLDDILGKFVFDSKWQGWIHGCLHSLKASVLVNGSPIDKFLFHRGLRQGDPLSLFLFILVTQSLHVAFKRVTDRGMFVPILVGKNDLVSISHLFYVDDFMFIGKWSRSNVNVLMMMLYWFFLVSGLKVNVHKSSLYGLGVHSSNIQSMANRFGYLANSLPLTYLGVKMKLLKDLKELAKYDQSTSTDRPIFLNDNEDRHVQNKESPKNSSEENVVLKTNQELPQDSDIHQLIEEYSIKVSEEQQQKMEDTMFDLVKICHHKQFLCIHDDVNDIIESALDSKLILINSNSQRLDKKEQEVKNVVEQPARCRNRAEKSLQNFRVIHKSSISFKNTSKISSIHSIAPIQSTKEPKHLLSMGYEHLSITPETESDEVTESNAENLLPIPKIPKSDFDFEEEIHLIENLLYDNSFPRPPKELNAEIADTIIESIPLSPIPVQDGNSQQEEIDNVTETDDVLPPKLCVPHLPEQKRVTATSLAVKTILTAFGDATFEASLTIWLSVNDFPKEHFGSDTCLPSLVDSDTGDEIGDNGLLGRLKVAIPNELRLMTYAMMAENSTHSIFFKKQAGSYIGGHVSSVNVVDIDEFCLHDLKDMVVKLGYGAEYLMYCHFLIPSLGLYYGLHSLNVDVDVLEMSKYVKNYKIILMYVEHGSSNVDNKEEESDTEGNDTSGSDSEDLDYDPKHDDVFDDDEHIVEEVHVNVNNFSFTTDLKHDTSIGVVDVQEDDLNVIDYDSFGSDLDDEINSERRIQLRELKRISKQKKYRVRVRCEGTIPALVSYVAIDINVFSQTKGDPAIKENISSGKQNILCKDKTVKRKGKKAQLSGLMYNKNQIHSLLQDILKGCPWPGQILTAVGVDANNEIYPVAYAIVEAENSIGTMEQRPFFRPPKKMKKSDDEIANQSASLGKLSRKGKSVSCGKCGNVGHNRKGCMVQGGGSSQAGPRKVSSQAASSRKVSCQAAGARNVSGQAAGARKASSQPIAVQSTTNQGPKQ
nr:RNA-directed DNA polymerase, eukaryota, reverse transcriptase zinc-binding domain protein [Tanacetum cinerariifolium]